MDFQRLTVKSQEAIAAAQELARRRGNPEIMPGHLLVALLDQELPQTLLGEQAAEVRAESEMRKLEDEFVSTEHLLLALDVVPRDALLAKLKEVRGGQRVTSQDPEEIGRAHV